MDFDKPEILAPFVVSAVRAGDYGSKSGRRALVAAYRFDGMAARWAKMDGQEREAKNDCEHEGS